MKIKPNFSAFNISASGMKMQKRKMDLVAENIANTGTTKTEEGKPYQKKSIRVTRKETFQNTLSFQGKLLELNTSNGGHIKNPDGIANPGSDPEPRLNMEVVRDESEGERLYMPDHPDADENGYVEMPNVNVVNEMVDMIAATRSYEANLTAFNASKQIAKDSLEI